MAKHGSPQKLVLTHHRAPGDIVVMTSLVRDIMLAHPGKFLIDVETSAMDIWKHNPYLTPLRGKRKKQTPADVRYIQMDYGRGIRDQNYEPVHFLAYFHRDFERKFNVKVPLVLPYPDLHLSPAERDVPLIHGRYWVVISGGKSDFTAKVWEAARMQQVCERLGDLGLGAVQVGSNDTGHWHPPMEGDNVVNLTAQTNLRDLIRLIYHSDGVICGITCAMHIAAALHRPCVVLAGGREAWWWEAYVRENKGFGDVADKIKVPHKFLHTIGVLDCCKHHGCWRNKVVSINTDRSLCYHPVMRPNQPVPLCLDMITVDHVMEAVMNYYIDHSLPPIAPANQRAVENVPQVPPVPPELPEKPPTATVAPAKKAGLLGLFDDRTQAVAAIQQQVAQAASKAPGCKAKASPPVAKMAKRASARLTLPMNHPLAQALQDGSVKIGMNPAAKLEGRQQQAGAKPQPPAAIAPGMPHPSLIPTDPGVFDHEDIGGKFTAFILFYGQEQHFDLHQQCLESLLRTTPRDRIDLRVGSNALNKKSVDMIERYVKQGVITKHYQHPVNAYKYPVMREMFWDTALPIQTKWVLWFDDDTLCTRTPAWLSILAQQIIQFHRRENAHMFGAPFVWTLQAGQKEWFESRPWYKGKPWRLHNGEPSPNGNKIPFATGGFWALTHEAIVKCDIPDTEIGHNGGDVCIGEQLYQGGFRMKSWNAKKQFILTSSVSRRGETKPMPGTPGHAALVPTLVRV